MAIAAITAGMRKLKRREIIKGVEGSRCRWSVEKEKEDP